jgi:hypothetical protein
MKDVPFSPFAAFVGNNELPNSGEMGEKVQVEGSGNSLTQTDEHDPDPSTHCDALFD